MMENERTRGEFLQDLFRFCEGGTINFRYLDPDGVAVNVFRPLSSLPALPAFPENKNIYFAMATRNGGGKKEHILQIPCLWCDIDFKETPQAEAGEALKEFPCPPSFVIHSGGGYHAYWLLRETLGKDDIPQVESVLRRLALHFKGDMASTDASRILRVPGTYNLKPEYKTPLPDSDPPQYASPIVKVLLSEPSRRYELSDFEPYLPSDEKQQTPSGEFKNPPGWQNQVLGGVDDGKRHKAALSLTGRYFAKGLEYEEVLKIMLAWNLTNKPPSDEGEIRRIVSDIGKKHPKNHEAESQADPLAFPSEIMTGAAGAFALTYTQYLEVPPHFLWISYLVCLGSTVAGLVTLDSEIHPEPRLFVILLGESADDRKSTALVKTVDFFRLTVDEFASCWGIGSAEGLQKLMAKKNNLLLVFDEFKQFVSKCKIEGSVLLPCINSLFENTWYESHTAKSDVTLDNAHLSLLAASTVQTYERIWDANFIDIGLPNRIFLVPGKGERRFSIPSKVGELPGLKNDLAEVLKHVGCCGEYPITPEARELYHSWYMGLQPSTHTKRLDTYALRFMVLLTANELKTEVDAKTVQDVITLMNWQLAVRQALDPIDADGQTARMEEKIRRALVKRNLTDRELKQAINANREGLWVYQVAMRNLRQAKEIGWERESKTWRNL